MAGSERERAVVLGGSIAGLLAARVLADTYPEVVVVAGTSSARTPARAGALRRPATSTASSRGATTSSSGCFPG